MTAYVDFVLSAKLPERKIVVVLVVVVVSVVVVVVGVRVESFIVDIS